MTSESMLADVWPSVLIIVGAIATAIAGYLAKLSASWVASQNERAAVQNEEVWNALVDTAIHNGIAYADDTEPEADSGRRRDIVRDYVVGHVPGALKSLKIYAEILEQKIIARIALQRRKASTP